MKKLLLGFLLVATSAYPDVIDVGVKAGVPLSDAFDAATDRNLRYFTDTKRWTVGPMVQLNLPFGLAVEGNALFHRLNFEAESTPPGSLRIATKADSWQFPVLLKFRMAPGPLRPYASLGPNFRYVTNIDQVRDFFQGEPIDTDDPPELDNRFTAGVTAALGLEIGAPIIKIAPEIRYTRWGWENFRSPGGLLRSNDNEFSFLLGITF